MKIKSPKILLLLAAFLYIGMAQGQEVSGIVSDDTGPLPGASVVVKGTTNGTQADFDGRYALSDIPEDAILVFSYIGYKSQEIAINGQTAIDVILRHWMKLL
jgi:iron complex outermembrane receptor protein